METAIELTLLQKLVALPTVSGKFLPNNQALDFIAAYLRERNMHVVRKEYDGYGALVATTRRTKTPTIMFAAHIDVVAGPDSMFHVRESEGKLYGRGVYDMKFAIAGYLALVDSMQEELDAYDFGIMITTDEETNARGVANLLADGFTPAAAVLLDGGYDWQLETGTKAAWGLQITVSGKTAHGSRPWTGDSASFKLHALLAEISQLFPDPAPDKNTLNISAIHVGQLGKVLNQVPDSADVTLDMRLISSTEHERIADAITGICKKYDAVQKTLVFFPALTHDLDNPFLAAFAASITQVTGMKNTGVISMAASDAVHFQEFGIPCAVTYPFGGGHHGEDEWLDKQSLLQLVPILLTYLEQVAKVPTQDTPLLLAAEQTDAGLLTH